MPWLSNTGKLILAVAGMVALLDLAGPARVAGWARRAKKWHDETNQRWASLTAARPEEARVRRTATWAASAPPNTAAVEASGPESEILGGLLAEDFLAFRRATWSAIRQNRGYSAVSLKDPQYIFPFFEEKAYQFFIERLPEPRRAALELAYQEVQKRQQRWQWMRRTFQGSLLPGTAILSWLLHAGGTAWMPSIIVGFLIVGVVALGSTAALMTPRFVTALLRAAATVRLGFAKAAVKAMGNTNDARPLRAIALGMFIVGSFADLIGGW